MGAERQVRGDIQAAQERVATLQRRVLNSARPVSPELLQESIEELSTALEELRVAEEELQQQNEELARARLEAEEQRQRYQHLFEFAPDGYLVTDSDGIILEANQAAAQLFGVQPKYLVGKPLVLFIRPTQTSKFYEELNRITHERTRREWTECLVPRAPGGNGPVYVSLTVAPVNNRADQLVALRWLLRDVTERQLAEERIKSVNAELERRVEERTAELQAADRRKNEFLAILGHELRNPLSPVLSALHIWRTGSDKPATREWCQEVIERQVRHMARLVDDLLDVSRIARGQIELNPQPTDLATLVGRAVESCRPLIEGHDHRLTVTLPREAVCLRADPTRLHQVFCNLLTNAAQYTERGGQIWLSGEVAGGSSASAREVVIRIRDTGIGLSPEMRERVFDLFVHGERLARRAEGGLGIGLTVVRTLVELHGGRVEAHSEGLGKGSEFLIRLPVALATPEITEPLPPAERSTAPAMNILVVEDGADAAQALAMLLGLWGHQVRVAHNGVEALQAAAILQPQLVLLDIGLPDLDGFQVAKQLRQLPGLEKVTLIAMTGYGQDEDRQRSEEAGFECHLVKPVDPQVMQTMIARLKDLQAQPR